MSKSIETKLRDLYKKRGVKSPKISISLNVEDLKKFEVSAAYIAQSIAWEIEKRIPARRVMKKYLGFMIQNRDIQGAKIKLSGRINGAEISRRESLAEGKLPLQTLRASIDYAHATAFNTYGTVGIKVWIYKGDVFEEK